MFKRTLIGALCAAALASCGDNTPACDDSRVMDKMKALLASTSYLAQRKNLECFGGCAPYIEGDRIQFHTLAVPKGAVKRNGVTATSLEAKLTFSISKSDFLAAMKVTAKDVRIISVDKEAKRKTCAADFNIALDLTEIKQKLPSADIILMEGFDGSIAMWQRTVQSTVKPIDLVNDLYRSMSWVNPVSYAAQLTNDGNVYVAVEQ